MNFNRSRLHSLTAVMVVFLGSAFAAVQESINPVSATTMQDAADHRSRADYRVASGNTKQQMDLTDPAFEQFANPGLIELAISTRDAALLADVALQWKRAEQVLGRSHHSGVAAGFLFETAARLAAQTGEEETLARLSRAAEAVQDNKLTSQIEAIKRLDGLSRASEQEWAIDVTQVDAATVGKVRQFYNSIQSTALTGDLAGLQNLAVQINTASLPESATQQLSIRVQNAIESVGASPDPSGASLRKLITGSRAICRKCAGTGRYFRGLNVVKCDRCNGSGAIPDNDGGYVGSWEMESSTGTSGGDVEIDSQVKKRFEFTLWNGSDKAAVTFRLGKLRTEKLSPGSRKSYSFVGNASDATLYVFNSKKEYKLRSGNHKFWSMGNGQIGFDMNNF